MAAVGKGTTNFVSKLLDMSGAARRRRAEDMGFDTKKFWYHGTPEEELEEFSRDKIASRHPASFGFHLTNQKHEARMYGDNVGRYVTRVENPLVYDLDFHAPYASASDKADSGRGHILEKVRAEADKGNYHDSVLIRRPLHDGVVNENLIVFDPEKIRSTKAAFDPEQRHSSKLLAGVGVPVTAGLVGSGIVAPEEAEAGMLGTASKFGIGDALMEALERRVASDGNWHEEVSEQLRKHRFGSDDQKAAASARLLEIAKGDAEVDYRGSHRAPTRDRGSPLHDVTGIYPDDIYSPRGAQYYGHGQPTDRAAHRVITQSRGKPDREVTMFRAVPNDPNITKINEQDWVTLTRQYAEEHGEGLGDYKVLEAKAKAGDLYTDGNSIYEWGYDPEKGYIMLPVLGGLAGAGTGAALLAPKLMNQHGDPSSLLLPEGSAPYAEAAPITNPRTMALSQKLREIDRDSPLLSAVLPVNEVADWAENAAQGRASWWDRAMVGLGLL